MFIKMQSVSKLFKKEMETHTKREDFYEMKKYGELVESCYPLRFR